MIKSPFVIISATTEKQSAVESFKQSYALRVHLRNSEISFKIISCKSNGVSFLIPNMSESEALDIAKMFNQESILFVDRYMEAQLVYTVEPYCKKIGYFRIRSGEGDNTFTINGIEYICTGG